MPAFTFRQIVCLLLITLLWGLNWPVMKLGVSVFPPLTFRMVSLWMAVPVLALVVCQQKAPWTVPRAAWPALGKLTLTNMLLWHGLMITAMPLLSSGRAAILAYTMPIISAMLGTALFGDRLKGRAWVGVGAAAAGVLLLLWHEVAAMGSRPVGVLLMLGAAASWALGTQWLRRTALPVPLITVTFWMVLCTAVMMTLLSVGLEIKRWQWPSSQAWLSITYNGLLGIGFAQAAWFFLARTLPPLASTLSVMFVPVIGVFSGAVWLGEVLHWQDAVAVGLMVLAIGSVLLPERRAKKEVKG